jgi:putative Mg2+ transporter-C (MgtC) family protein
MSWADLWSEIVSLVGAQNLEMTLRVGLALLVGAIPGLEREYHGSPAGLRTHMLVAGGAACFTLVSIFGFGDGADPSRVAAQIVSGVGFLGAGTIWLKNSGPGGLTTAAGIWMVAAIGMLLGAGMYWLAISSGFLLFVTLRILRSVKQQT